MLWEIYDLPCVTKISKSLKKKKLSSQMAQLSLLQTADQTDHDTGNSEQMYEVGHEPVHIHCISK